MTLPGYKHVLSREDIRDAVSRQAAGMPADMWPQGTTPETRVVPPPIPYRAGPEQIAQRPTEPYDRGRMIIHFDDPELRHMWCGKPVNVNGNINDERSNCVLNMVIILCQIARILDVLRRGGDGYNRMLALLEILDRAAMAESNSFMVLAGIERMLRKYGAK